MSDNLRAFQAWKHNQLWQFTEDFWIYSLNIGVTSSSILNTLASGATYNGSFVVQADSDFEWIMTTCFGNMHGATAPFTDGTILPITIMLADGGSGRQLFSQAVPLTALAGTGKQPFIMPVPRIFQSKSTVNYFCTNTDTANQYDNLYLNLIGRKVFDVGPARFDPGRFPFYVG